MRMNRRALAITIPTFGALGFVLGLVVGLKGCDDGDVTKLLAENARLKVEAEEHLADGAEASHRAGEAEGRLKAAMEQAEALRAREAASTKTIAALETVVRKAGRARDERDDLIEAQANELDRLKRVNLFDQEALQEALIRGDEYHFASEAHRKAAEANGKRADMLEKKVRKSRKQKIAIGVGSAVGGMAVAFGATYAATRVTR